MLRPLAWSIFFSMGFFCPVNCNQLIFLEASCRGLRCLKVFKGKALTVVSCLGLFVMLTRRRACSKLGDVFKLSECCWLKKRAIRRFNNCNMRLCMWPHLNMEHEALKDLIWLRWIASQPCSNDVWDVLCLWGASQLRRIHGGLPSNACGALIVMQGVNRHVLWSEDFQISLEVLCVRNESGWCNQIWMYSGSFYYWSLGAIPVKMPISFFQPQDLVPVRLLVLWLLSRGVCILLWVDITWCV